MKKNDNDSNALSYEASIRYLINKSNKRAWFIAFLSIIIAVISVTAVILLTPLKSVEPYIIRVDNTTGMVDIITTTKEEVVSENETLDKFFVSNYVKLREGYYWNILQQDYIEVQIYSDPRVAEEYRAIYEGANSIVDEYRNNTEVNVEINSITLGESAGVKNATVRFNRVIKNLQARTSVVETKIATISYDYTPTALVKEEERLINPLGFKVLTYRIDNEIMRSGK